jgi:hypothetical protein
MQVRSRTMLRLKFGKTAQHLHKHATGRRRLKWVFPTLSGLQMIFLGIQLKSVKAK